MIEAIICIFFGLLLAVFFPDTFEKFKLKVLSIVYRDHKCKDEPKRYRH